MRIPKKVLYISSSIFLLCVLTLFGFLTLVNIESSEKIQCLSFSELYSVKKCGYITVFANKNTHKIVGVIKSKYKIDSDYAIDLQTNNSYGKVIIIPIFISKDPLIKNVTLIRPFKNISKDNLAAKTNPITSSKELYNLLNINDEVIVNLIVADEKQILKAKKIYGDFKEFNCNVSQKLTIDYLKESSFINYLKSQIYKFTSGCKVYTLHIEKLSNEK